MFAHEVIESLQAQANRFIRSNHNDFKLYRRVLAGTIEKLKTSHKFHIGEMHELFELFQLEQRRDQDQYMFKGGLAQSVRLPYRSCWFEFTDRNWNGEKAKQQEPFATRGCLVEEITPSVMSVSLLIGDSEKRWTLPYYHYFVSIDSPLNQHLDACRAAWSEIDPSLESFEAIEDVWDEEDCNVKFIPLVPKSRREEDFEEECIADSLRALGALNLTLMLLNTQNIGTERHSPPEKLNRARVRRNRQPKLTYYTLVLKRPTKQGEATDKGLWDNRVHFCRGHFKYFTPEKPLFGHIVGRYWWQPQVRGRNKEGVVLKDYEVKLDSYRPGETKESANFGSDEQSNETNPL